MMSDTVFFEIFSLFFRDFFGSGYRSRFDWCRCFVTCVNVGDTGVSDGGLNSLSSVCVSETFLMTVDLYCLIPLLISIYYHF